MLFRAINNPLPTRPSEVCEFRKKYWPWAHGKLDRELARFIFERTGRGAVALFDIDSSKTPHGMVPAEFEVYPPTDPDAAVAYLNGTSAV